MRQCPRFAGSALLCASILAMAAGSALAGSAVLSEDFAGDPAAAGWTAWSPDASRGWLYGPYTGPAWWSAGDGYATVATDRHMIHSPEFAVSAGAYYRVTYSARGAGDSMLETVCTNPAATYGLWKKPPSWTGEPNELTPISTQIAPADDWTTRVEYVRMRSNAAAAYVRFQAGRAAEGAGPLAVDDVSVRPAAGAGEVSAWADAVYAEMPSISYAPTDPARFAGLERTRQKLLAGEPVTLCMLGDSIMDDSANSTLDVLLGRRFGSDVTVIDAVGSGTSMKDWNDPNQTDPAARFLNLQANVIDKAPDLVMMGGISNRTEPGAQPCYDDFRDVIDKVRDGVRADHGYDCDILLLTGVLSEYGDAPGYAAGLSAIAGEKGAAVFDIRAAWDEYLVSAASEGWAHADFMRDSYVVHGNTYGKQAVGRILEAHLAPEPGALALLGLGAVWRTRRRLSRRA